MFLNRLFLNFLNSLGLRTNSNNNTLLIFCLEYSVIGDTGEGADAMARTVFERGGLGTGDNSGTCRERNADDGDEVSRACALPELCDVEQNLRSFVWRDEAGG